MARGLVVVPFSRLNVMQTEGLLFYQAQTRAELAEWVAVVTPLLLALDVLLVAQGIEHP